MKLKSGIKFMGGILIMVMAVQALLIAPVQAQDGGPTTETNVRIKGEPLVSTDAASKVDSFNGSNISKSGAPVNRDELQADLDKAVAAESENLPVRSAAGWSLLTYETFEGTWPENSPGWASFDNTGSLGVCWDDTSYLPYGGSYSAWAANGCVNGLEPSSFFYPNGMDSWMTYGPFDLSKSVSADFNFYYWNQSEFDFDHFSWCTSSDGLAYNCSTVSGDSLGWRSVYVSLNSYLGDSSVYIAFIFDSDGSNMDDGAFVDNVAVWSLTQSANFNSNFNSSHKGWSPLNGSWSHLAGRYYQTPGVPNKFTSIKRTGNFYVYDYRVKMKRLGCVDCSNSIFVGGVPKPLKSYGQWKSTYLLSYTNGGYFSVFKVNGSKVVALKNWTRSGAINKNGFNVLRAVDNDTYLKFYINGKLVFSKIEYSLPGSVVGAGFYVYGAGNQLLLDSASLTTKNVSLPKMFGLPDIVVGSAEQTVDPSVIFQYP